MGQERSEPAADMSELPDYVDLPHYSEDHWDTVSNALGSLSSSLENLSFPNEAETAWQELVNCLHVVSGMDKNPFNSLRIAVTAFGDEKFFTLTLPFIISQALALPTLFPESTRLPFLTQHEQVVSFTKEQSCCLLSAGFFSLYRFLRDPSQSWARMIPGLNFDLLFVCSAEWDSTPAKIRLFLTYFERIRSEDFVRAEVSFKRLSLPHPTIEEADEEETEAVPPSPNPLEHLDDLSSFIDPDLDFTDCEILPEGSLRDCPPPSRHADFANRRLGGGVFGHGCVQEEILFAECPECCVGMLFCPVMNRDEAIVISGVEQFGWSTGYARSLGFDEEAEEEGRRMEEIEVTDVDIVAMDAMDYRSGFVGRQFGVEHVSRDVWKAFVAFSGAGGKRISTGNWGCGAFRGDKNLKFVEQYIAAAANGCPMSYYTFRSERDAHLTEQYIAFVEFVRSENVKVKEVYESLLKMKSMLTVMDADPLRVSTTKVLMKMLRGETEFTIEDVSGNTI